MPRSSNSNPSIISRIATLILLLIVLAAVGLFYGGFIYGQPILALIGASISVVTCCGLVSYAAISSGRSSSPNDVENLKLNDTDDNKNENLLQEKLKTLKELRHDLRDSLPEKNQNDIAQLVDRQNEFTCPITQLVPVDPVYAICNPPSANQQVFEKSALVTMMEQAGLNHPITKETLTGETSQAADFFTKFTEYCSVLDGKIAELEKLKQENTLGNFSKVIQSSKGDYIAIGIRESSKEASKQASSSEFMSKSITCIYIS